MHSTWSIRRHRTVVATAPLLIQRHFYDIAGHPFTLGPNGRIVACEVIVFVRESTREMLLRG